MPGGFCDHWYEGVAVHSPFVPLPVLPVKLVAGRAARLHVNVSVPAAPGLASASAPPAARYHERAVVPGSGKRENERSKPGDGIERRAPGAVVEQDPHRGLRLERGERRVVGRLGLDRVVGQGHARRCPSRT